jgi:hypothetical protein
MKVVWDLSKFRCMYVGCNPIGFYPYHNLYGILSTDLVLNMDILDRRFGMEKEQGKK